MTTTMTKKGLQSLEMPNQSALEDLIQGLNANIETSKNADMVKAYKVVLMAANDLLETEKAQKIASYKKVDLNRIEFLSSQLSETLANDYNNSTYKPFIINKKIAAVSLFVVGILFSTILIRF
jgi:hypothetical protein